jgi:hypothetical protein
MTDIVTSDVIRLAKWHENEAVRLRKHPNADISSAHGLAEMHGETASTLYMLLAERDAAKLQAAEAVVALNNRDRERMQAEREARAAEAERDAAIMDADMQAREAGNMEYNARVLMAERDRLREALRKVRDELGGSGQTHASLLRAFNIAYAALKETGHE